MEEKKKLKQLIEQAEEENAKLERMRKALKAELEYVKLEQRASEIEARREVLRKKGRAIENRIREKYLTDDSYGAWYYPKESMYHRTNIKPHFIQAIKDVTGNISKLRGSDIRTIINSLMHEDTYKATVEIIAEQEKFTAEEKELYNKLRLLEHTRLSQQSTKAGELFHQANILKQKPQRELEEFRNKAVANETLEKIRQRAKELEHS